MPRRLRPLLITLFAVALWYATDATRAQIRQDPVWSPRAVLAVIDDDTGEPTAARFSIEVDGAPHEPGWVGPHGLRFVSVHVSKRQTQAVFYARGTGPVEFPLIPGARQVRIHLAKGLSYQPLSIEAEVGSDPLEMEARLKRWNTLDQEGWRAADAHLHYDRVEPSGDRDWFHMLAADGLDHAQFMVLKGGMVPGVWARQYAYGSAGVHSDGERTLIPGEEYRDSLQGHTLLFGLSKIIQPIMAGRPDAPYNFPPLHDVLLETRRLGGMPGIAHGGRYGAGVTATLDAVLGAVDFWEIGNAHLYYLDDWYRLMNCGFLLPPSAGTDLPNNPYRDPWQPFLGSMRMYVRTGGDRSVESWNRAVKQGAVFVSSGPILQFTVNGKGPGETVRLPADGGEVRLRAELASTQPLQGLEIVRGGETVVKSERSAMAEGAHRIVIEQSIHLTDSTWLAARGAGIRIGPVAQDAVAHTAAVEVWVGDAPIWSAADAKALQSRFQKNKEFYRDNGRYEKPEDLQRVLDLHDRGIERLQQQGVSCCSAGLQ